MTVELMYACVMGVYFCYVHSEPCGRATGHVCEQEFLVKWRVAFLVGDLL